MDAAPTTRSGRGRAGMVAIAALTVVGVVGLGLSVISVVNALESKGCGPYGYGGYCPPPSVRVEPSANLVDGQTVGVFARGFHPNASFGAAQCEPTFGGIEGCDLSTAVLTSTDDDGHARLNMRVRRVITVQGREVDCAVRSCVVGVATLRNGTIPVEQAAATVHFDPSVPPLAELEVRVVVTSVTPRGMTGRVTCNRAAEAFLSGSAMQRPNVFAYGFTRQAVACGPDAQAWGLRFTETNGQLMPGPARFVLVASAHDGLDSVFSEVSGPITVTAG